MKNCKQFAFPALRILLGITFIWIGYLIWQDPLGWGGYLQPWALELLVTPLEQAMLSAAILDIVVGLLLIINRFTWLAGFLASVHLVIVLVTSGFNEATIRDIGILAGTLYITCTLWPQTLKEAIQWKE